MTSAISEMSPSMGAQAMRNSHVRTVPAPDRYRSGMQDVGATFAAHVQAAIAGMVRDGIRPAALLVDTIFSGDGVFANPAGFLAPAAAAIRAAGGLFIADEVQPGFGRTGDAMWGFQRHGVVPDMVMMGKPIGNGHPMAALVARPALLERFGKQTRYFNTFGGNPVSCAVGQAVLDVIEDEGLMQNAKATCALLRDGNRGLADRHVVIGNVRGAGLFVDVELVTDRDRKTPATQQTTRLVNALRERRVLISAAGPHANVLKIRPPLVFQAEHVGIFLEAFDDALTESVLAALDRSACPRLQARWASSSSAATKPSISAGVL